MVGRYGKALLERLTPHCASAFEAGAGFAVTRGHYEVTVEHVAVKLLEAGGGDFDRLLNGLGVDLDGLWQGLLDNLNRQKGGSRGKPVFSVLLWQWLERAWLAASLHYGSAGIRSGALLDALLELAPTLPGSAFEPLAGISAEQLRRRFAELTAGSVEGTAAAAPASNRPAASAASPSAPSGEGALDRFTIDLTARAAGGEIDPVLGRSAEIPPGDRHSHPPPQEQPDPRRGARGRQDRHRRGACAAGRRGRGP